MVGPSVLQVLSFMGKSALNTAKSRSVVPQMAVGGVLGGLTSDSDSPTNKFKDIVSGAAMGGVIGLGARILPRNMTDLQRIGKFSKSMYTTYSDFERMGIGPLSATKLLAGSAIQVGKFAIEHPFLTAGTGIGLYAATNRNIQFDQQSSPTIHGLSVGTSFNMRTNVNQLAMGLDTLNQGEVSPMRTSIPVIPKRERDYSNLMQSTTGLVQGLHNGRHGG